MDKRMRILFVAEAVTLAHVARPLVLAQALPPETYEVHFACPTREVRWLKGLPLKHWPLNCISSARFLGALAHGAPPYDLSVLHGYVEQDLDILDAVKPDLVVGDFRLSLPVSAGLRKIPHVNICNAYWSPYCSDTRYPLPDHPAIRFLGLGVVSAAFQLMAPALLAQHSRVYNKLRRAYDQPPLADLRHLYSQGDHVLYADVPSLAPLLAMPENHHFIGPILWSPNVALPDWWHQDHEECLYITFGSSGAASLLPSLLRTLAELPFQLLVATGGRVDLPRLTANIRSADYLPGVEACRRARLVICNGGSPTVYQALSQGTPVLGIPSNMDQFLNMQWVERAQAGRMVRTQHLQPKRLRAVVDDLLNEPRYSDNARRLADEISRHPSGPLFCHFVEKCSASA
jgi:UDP:flavonoid glycosyltransferase YjiC (YdhE family)